MRKYPIALLGYIHGPVRLEGCGGIEWYPGAKNEFLFFQKPIPGQPLSDFFAVTHLQKKSLFGFLLMWPLCFHVWFSFRKQQTDKNGQWIPGTEKVFYWRIGVWRWDAGDCKYIGPGIWYGPGLRWD